MLSALFFLAAAPIPSGAYALPELCNRLYVATGAGHTTEIGLRDYPVFVSVKSGDPERIRQLVAVALHATWLKDGEKFRLVPLKVTPKEDFAEFERRLKLATAGKPVFAAIPAADLYALAPGDVIRYSRNSGGVVKPMPQAMIVATSGDDDPDRRFAMRRMGPGVFETSPGDPGIEFRTLPEEAKKFLGDTAGKEAMTAEAQAKLRAAVQDPKFVQEDFKDLSKRDPIATLSSPMLEAVAKVMEKDLVMALPDISLFAASGGGGGRIVQDILGEFSMGLSWTIEGDALVGKLTTCELTTPSQVRRTVIGRFLNRMGESGVANISILKEYLASQRTVTSNSWLDVLFLVLSGTTVDQEYLIDHPFNVRLYASFTQQDWERLRSEEPFSAAALSRNAQQSLRDLLLCSRRAQDKVRSDPAYWPSIAPSALKMSASMEEEQVLVQVGVIGSDVHTIKDAAANYDLRKSDIQREPLYRLAKRVKLKLMIYPVEMADPDKYRAVATGFSEVTSDPKAKPCEWRKLPAAVAKEFEETLKARRG